MNKALKQAFALKLRQEGRTEEEIREILARVPDTGLGSEYASGWSRQVCEVDESTSEDFSAFLKAQK